MAGLCQCTERHWRPPPAIRCAWNWRFAGPDALPRCAPGGRSLRPRLHSPSHRANALELNPARILSGPNQADTFSRAHSWTYYCCHAAMGRHHRWRRSGGMRRCLGSRDRGAGGPVPGSSRLSPPQGVRRGIDAQVAARPALFGRAGRAGGGVGHCGGKAKRRSRDTGQPQCRLRHDGSPGAGSLLSASRRWVRECSSPASGRLRAWTSARRRGACEPRSRTIARGF